MTRNTETARYVALDQRGVVAVTGPDARPFLQGLVTNDVDRLTPDRAIYAAVLTPQGKFLHDFLMAQQGDRIWLDCERDRADDLIVKLGRFKLRADVTLTNVSDSLSVVAAFGPAAADALALDGGQPGQARPLADGIAFVDPRHTALGARIIAPAAADAAIAAGLEAGDASAYERLRLSLGVPDGSRDFLVDKIFLLEGNAESLHGVDFDKGCYVGQETTTRQKHRGQIRKRLMPVGIDGPMPAPGEPIMLGDREAGIMRSGLDDRAIAFLRLEYVDKAAASGQPLLAGDTKVRPLAETS